MERDALEKHLAAGLSLERIGELVGKHPSTVGYWVKKHGLQAAHADRHAPRGGLRRDELDALLASGSTLRQIAEITGRSLATVRYWIRRFGLETSRASVRGSAEERPARARRRCRRHGETEFVLERKRYYRCSRCRMERVAARRRRMKEILVAEAGGRCQICGYARHLGALEFHHLDPSQKSFGVSLSGLTRGLDEARAEAAKCVLLCSNCHAEVEGGVVALRLPSGDSEQLSEVARVPG